MDRDSKTTTSDGANAADAAEWYAGGLRFECHGCGTCCRGEGYVWVDRAAARRLAKHLGLGIEEFGSRYLRRVRRRYSLTEKPNHDCIFWSDGDGDRDRGGCKVYEARPAQCRTFPFWPENLASLSRWRKAAATCGGMNTGRLYEIGKIREIRSSRAETSESKPSGDSAASCGCGAADQDPGALG